MLINLIANHFEQNKIHLNLSSSYRLEKEIIERFPNEKMEYYRNGKRGRIYNKGINIRTGLNKALGSSPTPSKHTRCEKISKGRKLFVPESNADDCIKSLKFDNLTAEQFDNYWMACAQHRLHTIQNANSTSEIFEQWEHYKGPLGHRLINMDFGAMFDTTYSLLDNFNQYFPHILEFLNIEKKVKEREMIKLLESLRLEDFNETVVKEKTGKNSTLKYTIKDSQEAFLFIAKSPQEVEDHLLHLQQRSGAIQPFVIAVGEGITECKDFFVYFDGVKFQFKSLIRAVDICFKTFHLFNLHYPIACSSFWTFIQLFFYKITPTSSNPRIQILIDFLKKKKNCE
ncbi:uncharacterized protein LOC129942758 isoform X2 [Eupeodes corollae]|uniref:uncharacterized protein LOC129942758 isoform X2 n=1 Tax=Eupeodes corollae TaxID=290404 RepID=UPI002492F86A|nr:uncharacterized protein LOC129942758 isoform X2 [Eupeodes corollae]